MPLTQLPSAPDASLWKKLDEHQASTPATFSEAVLHCSCTGAKLVLSSDQKALLPGFFDEEKEEEKKEKKTDGEEEEEEEEDEDWEDGEEAMEDVILEGVDVHAVSDKLILYVPSRSAGVEIPYPQVTLHALTTTTTSDEKQPSVYMQIDPHGSAATFDDYNVGSLLEITVIPTTTTPSPSAADLYQALTDCSNLHPEPNNDWDGIAGGENEDRMYFDHEGMGSGLGLGGGISFLGGADEVGGIPALAPGGWITADNADSITWTDEDGKTGVGLGSLGPGAGTVRKKEDEEEDGGDAEADGGEEEGVDGGEAKWRRTG